MKSTKELINQHLIELCDVIGARPTGSEENKAAVHYAAEVFDKLGFEVALQEFPCMDWKNEGASLIVDGEEVEVSAAEYSLPCDVSGELVCLETIDDLKSADLHNKIAVIYGELCKEPLMPKNFTFWNPEEHKEIIRQLEEKNPLAIIAVSFLADVPVPIIQDGDFEIPCATVKGDLLNTFLNSKDVSLKLHTERIPSVAANVIATYGAGAQKISFSAHIDTKPTTPGALDNGSGVATLLALAEKVAGKEFPYRIEFSLFNGEDYYSIPGEVVYMSSYLSHPEEYICAFNVDGVGMKDSNISYSFYECPEELEKKIDGFAADMSDIEKIDPWPMGDHMIYASAGVPAIAITATNIFSLMESVLHTSADSLTIIDVDGIVKTVDFLYGCM